MPPRSTYARRVPRRFRGGRAWNDALLGEGGESSTPSTTPQAASARAGNSSTPLFLQGPAPGAADVQPFLPAGAPATPGTAPAVQHAPGDLQIQGEYEPTADDEAKYANFAFFDLGSATLSSAQEARVKAFAAAQPMVTTPISLRGYASEEGAGTFNESLAQSRAQAVARALVAAGHDEASITSTAMPAASQGDMTYRRWRSVEMLAGSQKPAVPDCSTAPKSTPWSKDQEAAFSKAKTTGLSFLAASSKRLREKQPPKKTVDLVTHYFGKGASLTQIADNLDVIHGTLSSHSAGDAATPHGSECDDGCLAGWTAYHRNSSLTFCDPFFAEPEIQQARILVHECGHSNAGLAARDRAYGYERMIDVLGQVEPGTALKNSDSHALFAFLDNDAKSLPDAGGFTDDLSALETAQQDEARIDFAYVQHWLISADITVPVLYEDVNKGIAEGRWVDEELRWHTQTLLARFGLPPLNDHPRDRDRAALAAIADRINTLREAMKQTFTVTPAAGSAANSSWEPGPGDEVHLVPAFWKLSRLEQIRILVRRLAEATPDISPGRVTAYVEGIDQLRTARGDGP